MRGEHNAVNGGAVEGCRSLAVESKADEAGAVTTRKGDGSATPASVLVPVGAVTTAPVSRSMVERLQAELRELDLHPPTDPAEKRARLLEVDRQLEAETTRVFALQTFAAADDIEAMLAGQAVALHVAAMECLRRAMIAGQPSDTASKLRRDGANLARCMTDMLAAWTANAARVRRSCGWSTSRYRPADRPLSAPWQPARALLG